MHSQGVSYTLSTQSLPSLLTLPSAKPAAYTLTQTTRLATLHIRTLSTIASLSLALAFYLSPSRVRHPYLLWTSLVAAASGGLNLAMDRRMKKPADELDVEEVNGEQVEKKARDQQWIEFVRTGVSGLGFVMGVVGLWGDGA
jgi:autophagy-related protein 33